MRTLMILSLMFLMGCASFSYDRASQRCRDNKTGEYVETEKCCK